MVDVAEVIGLLAAFLTTAAYVPQVAKTWASGSARDFSLPMLAMLATGVALWLVYGLAKGLLALTLANAVSLGLVSFILAVKVRRG